MKKSILILIFFLSAAAADAGEFALLDTSIFGKNIQCPVVVLSPHSASAVKPVGVFIDTDKDTYHTATLHFRNVDFAEILDELTDLYDKPNFESSGTVNFATWRIASEKFAITVSEERGDIKILYIYAKPKKLQ